MNVLEDLAEVYIPDGLVIPDLRGQDDGPQHHTLPVARMDVNLRVGQQPLQVHLQYHKHTQVYLLMTTTHRCYLYLLLIIRHKHHMYLLLTTRHRRDMYLLLTITNKYTTYIK